MYLIDRFLSLTLKKFEKMDNPLGRDILFFFVRFYAQIEFILQQKITKFSPLQKTFQLTAPLLLSMRRTTWENPPTNYVGSHEMLGQVGFGSIGTLKKKKG
jgi:hypothetical protein